MTLKELASIINERIKSHGDHEVELWTDPMKNTESITGLFFPDDDGPVQIESVQFVTQPTR